MSRKKKNGDMGDTVVIVLIVIFFALVFIIKTVLTFIAVAYPFAAVFLWLLARFSKQPPPTIPNPSLHQRPEKEQEVRHSIYERNRWQGMLASQYEAGEQNGIGLTAKSDHQLFDERTKVGKTLNRNIEICRENLRDAENEIQAIASEVRLGFSDYWDFENSFAEWAKKQNLFFANDLSLLIFCIVFVSFMSISAVHGNLWPENWPIPVFFVESFGPFAIALPLGAIIACAVFALVFYTSKSRWASHKDLAKGQDWQHLVSKWYNPESILETTYAGESFEGESEEEDYEQSAGANDNSEAWYVVLGVSPDASEQTIKDRYHHLVKKNHPDQVSGLSRRIQEVAEAEMKRINVAFDAARQERSFR